MPFLQVGSVVAHVDTAQFYRPVGGIVELHPSVEVKGRAYKFIDVGGHDLIDDHRLGSSRIVCHVDRHAART